MAYEMYAAMRRDLLADVRELSSRHGLFVETALELFDDVAAYAVAERSALWQSLGVHCERVEINLEGGLFVAERTKRQSHQEVVTALASIALETNACDVVKHVFRNNKSFLSSRLFRTTTLDIDVLCDGEAKHDDINRYDVISVNMRDSQRMQGISIMLPVVDSKQAYYDNLRPSEQSLRFPTVQAIVGHRICETIDLMAGFAGRR